MAPTVGTFRNARSTTLNRQHIQNIYRNERRTATITFRLNQRSLGTFIAERTWALPDGSLEPVIDEILEFIGRDEDVVVTMHF